MPFPLALVFSLFHANCIVYKKIQNTRKEGITGDGWRQNATALLDEMRQNGVGIVMPPAEGEFPQEGLPFAEGRKITSVFAFAGAAEALRLLSCFQHCRNTGQLMYASASASRPSVCPSSVAVWK